VLILYVKVPRPGDSEVTFFVFGSSCHLLLPVLPLKGRGNPVIVLSKGTREFSGLSSHYPFNAERQAVNTNLKGN